ncbi:MAG TPA: tetratricopeptide repeat protein, partial [Terriglobales bacterium]
MSNDDLAAAQALYRSGKFAEAQQKYEALVKSNAKNPLAQAGLVRALLAQERVEQASDVAASAVAAMPDAEPVIASLGEVQFRQAQMPQAEKSLLRASRTDPKDPLPLLALAELYDSYSLHRRAYD